MGDPDYQATLRMVHTVGKVYINAGIPAQPESSKPAFRPSGLNLQRPEMSIFFQAKPSSYFWVSSTVLAALRTPDTSK